MLPSFLRPERVPYASITIVRETPRVEFHALITHPATGPRLDKMLADNERLDDELQAERDAEDERDRWDMDNAGSSCGAGCGYCGRCS